MECERAGAYAVLAKPVVVERLLDRLAEIGEGIGARADRAERAAEQLPGAGEDLISRELIDEVRQMGLGEEFVQRFLVECARDARKCIADLETAGAASRWESYRDAAHGLKGAAGNMGAVQLAAAASTAMRMGSEQLQASWRAQLSVLRQQLEQALTALQERGDLPRADAETDRR